MMKLKAGAGMPAGGLWAAWQSAALAGARRGAADARAVIAVLNGGQVQALAQGQAQHLGLMQRKL